MTSADKPMQGRGAVLATGYTLFLALLYLLFLEMSMRGLTYLNEHCIPGVPWFSAVWLALCFLWPANHRSAWPIFHLSRNSSSLLILVGLAIPICLATFFIPMFVIAPVIDLYGPNSNIFAAAAAIPVLSALMEEIAFRGILQGGLERHMKPGASMLITTIIFLAAHAGAAWFLREIAFYATLSLICGLLATRAKSVLPAAILHVAINAVGVIITSKGPIDIRELPASMLIAFVVLLAFCIYSFAGQMKRGRTT